jgi:hypothetical protein
MKKSVNLRAIDKVIEEVSNNHKEIWDRIMNKKFGELSRDELLEFLKITMEGAEKMRAKKDDAEEK